MRSVCGALVLCLLAVAVGGSAGSGSADDGSGWTNLSPEPSPSPRALEGLAYDAQSDRVILFGGVTDATPHDGETWAYDYSTNTWTNLSPAVAPSGRNTFAMTYDARADRVILFGGSVAAGLNSETWAYDYGTNTWTNLSPDVAPPARTSRTMAYDAGSDRTILFGGWTGSHFQRDTWAYNYDANTWENLTRGNGSTPYAGNMMAYDAGSDRMVLFGGASTDYPRRDNSFLDATWTYDFASNTWAKQDPISSPPATDQVGIAYDAAIDRTVVFGGFTSHGESDETWAYDLAGNAWHQINVATRPSARAGHTMVYDAKAERTILFGGPYDPLGNETWALDLVGPGTTPGTSGSSPIPAPSVVVVAGVMAGAALAGAIVRRRVPRGKGKV